jgi:DNA-binding CsgD family transcriptional regulator
VRYPDLEDRLAGQVPDGQQREAGAVTGLVDRFGRAGREGLTGTERGVADLVAGGLTNQQVANQIFLGVHTVAFHPRQIFRKIGIKSRVELTRVVVQRPLDSRRGGAHTYSSIPPQRRGRPYPSSW